MPISDYLGNKIIDKAFRNVDFTVAAVKMSLHTAAPARTGANEVAGGSYARQSAAFIAAANRASDTSAAIAFAGMPATTVTHAGLWDDGNFLLGGKLAAPKTTNAGDTFQVNAGDCDLSIEWGSDT